VTDLKKIRSYFIGKWLASQRIPNMDDMRELEIDLDDLQKAVHEADVAAIEEYLKTKREEFHSSGGSGDLYWTAEEALNAIRDAWKTEHGAGQNLKGPQ